MSSGNYQKDDECDWFGENRSYIIKAHNQLTSIKRLKSKREKLLMQIKLLDAQEELSWNTFRDKAIKEEKIPRSKE